jgi:hypothetical protein
MGDKIATLASIADTLRRKYAREDGAWGRIATTFSQMTVFLEISFLEISSRASSI